MRRRRERFGLALVAMALITTSCGAGSESNAPIAASSNGAPFTSAFAADDPVVVRASELALLLVSQLGDDATATGALLRAADDGFDALQIEAAIIAGDLTTDGIADDQPRLPAYGRVAARRIAQQDTKPLPIEDLRREATEAAGREDYWPTGARATALILALQLQGYSQSQIVDILIFGAEILDGNYTGTVTPGAEECGGFVIGGVHEIPQFCDAESGELFPDLDEDTTEPSGDDQAVDPPPSGSDGLCDGAFAPPYDGVAIKAVGAMLETVLLGPLETPYYYTEVSGFLDVAADGSFTLAANTTRLADITIRDLPDNQIYNRTFDVAGSFDQETGDGAITGEVTGTDRLWAEAPETQVEAQATGQIAVICDDDETSGFFIAGFATGQGLLEFEARP